MGSQPPTATCRNDITWIPSPPGPTQYDLADQPSSGPVPEGVRNQALNSLPPPARASPDSCELRVPATKEELWAALRERLKERIKELRDQTPKKRQTLIWDLPKYMAALAMVDNPDIRSFSMLTFDPERWGKDLDEFRIALDIAIGVMVETVVTIVSICMNAGNGDDDGDIVDIDQLGDEAQDRNKGKGKAKGKGKGNGSSEGAQVLAVHAWASLPSLICRLKMFFPPADVHKFREALQSDKGGFINILPLEATAHEMLDRHEFAIRPVQCLCNPEKHMYLQLDNKLVLDPTSFERVESGLMPDKCLSNYCRLTDDKQGPRFLEHGDIVDVYTDDPVNRPLPSYDILRIVYAISRVIGALKGAGLLREFFRGPPPDADPPRVPSDVELTEFQEMFFVFAVETGVMTADEACRRRLWAIVQQEEELNREPAWARAVRAYREDNFGPGVKPPADDDDDDDEDDRHDQGGAGAIRDTSRPLPRAITRPLPLSTRLPTRNKSPVRQPSLGTMMPFSRNLDPFVDPSPRPEREQSPTKENMAPERSPVRRQPPPPSQEAGKTASREPSPEKRQEPAR